MKNEILGYENYLRNEKSSAENTIVSYVHDAKRFLSAMEEEEILIATCAERDVEQYAKNLIKNGASIATATRAVAAVKSFYQYLIFVGKLQENPARGVKIEKIERRFPQILTGDEVNLLLSQPSQEDPKGIRDRAMLELLYATGIRVSELVDLNVQDVDLSDSSLRCQKKNKVRMIPMYPRAVQVLNHYITFIRPQIVLSNQESALFVNMLGQRLTRQGFWKLIKVYQEKAGIEKNVTPHTLRHSFAAHLLENGAEVGAIQEMMGHADIASTQFYARAVRSETRNAYLKAHPNAK